MINIKTISDFHVTLHSSGNVELETEQGIDTVRVTSDEARELIQYFVEAFGEEVLDGL